MAAPLRLAHYLRDMVYGAVDGTITTFAVVAGAEGAQLGSRVVVILGLANVVADGFSMGASNYMGIRSEVQQHHGDMAKAHPFRHALATFIAFFLAGLVPLAAYFSPVYRPQLAAVLALATLVLIGALRGHFIPGKSRIRLALEIAGVGMLAGAAAFGVGELARRLVT